MVIKMETLIPTVKIKMTEKVLRETFAQIVDSVRHSFDPLFLSKVGVASCQNFPRIPKQRRSRDNELAHWKSPTSSVICKKPTCQMRGVTSSWQGSQPANTTRVS
jgi:hypothetical protein